MTYLRTFMVWFLGILGGIAAFLGLFILLAGDDQYVGIGGDLSWRVGDISLGWAYGLLVGGAVLLLISLGTLLVWRRAPVAARVTDDRISSLVWHASIFTVVNAFIWFQDIVLGDGLNYAYWITIPWAVGLAVHAGTALLSRGQETPVGERGPERTAREDEKNELQPH